MARWQPLQFVGGAYTDDATPWTSQDCVNYIPVSAEKAGTRSPQMLRQAPGCRLFTADGVTSPVRGLHNAEGLLVAVKGQTLYSYDSEGAATSLGTIPGVKRCSIAHNQITSGNQIAIANGSSGYVYNTVTGVLAQITDEGFPGAKVFDFVDQYIVGVEPAGRYWFHSDLSAATDYNTLDRYEAETAPDKIVTLIATHGEVFVLGERTSEFFYNTGQATGTFQRRDAGMEIGCAAAHSVVRLDNSVVWLGHDGSVYRLNGYQPQRISTHAIEQAIARCNVADAYAYTFEDRGHKVYYLTFTDGQTFGFDMATGLWHRRKSYGLDFWRMSHLVRWGRTWVGGDYTNGSLYILDWRRNDDAGEPLERINTLAPIHDNGNRLIVNAIKIEIDAGKTSASFPSAYEPPAPSITGDVPDGYVGEAVSYAYTVTGGVQPVTVTVQSGTTPPGLTFNSDGTVEGTYTTAGSYSWVMLATDAQGQTSTVADDSTVRSFIWMIQSPTLGKLYVTTDPLADDWDNSITHSGHYEYVHLDGERIILSQPTSGSGATYSDDYLNTAAQSATAWPASQVAPLLILPSGRYVLLQVHGSAAVVHYSDNGLAGPWTAVALGQAASFIAGDDDCLIATSGSTRKVSTDGGETWGAGMANGFTCTSLGYQRIDPDLPGLFLFGAGSGGSAFRWTVDGTTLTACTGTFVSAGQVVSFLPLSDGAWLAAVSGATPQTTGNFFRSANGKTGWAPVTTPSFYFGSGTDGQRMAERDGVIVASGANASNALQIVKSVDGGVTWSLVTHGYIGTTFQGVGVAAYP